MLLSTFTPFLAFISSVSAAILTPKAEIPRNDGIHLAVEPRCGTLSGSTSDVNAGLIPERFKTVVAFGDSYTDGGKSDGSPLDPAVIVPPNPEAGGRSTNGPTWVENFASDIGAHVMDYAQSAACVDLSLWPSNPKKVDFLGQMNTFLGQSNPLNPNTTLYTIFFGINDYLASLNDGDHMVAAAQTLLEQIAILASPPTNARNVMVLDVYGRGTVAPQGESFKQTIFSGLEAFHLGTVNATTTTRQSQQIPKLDVAYVDFSTIWMGVLGSSPGYQAFGYTSTDACTLCNANGCTTEGMCDDPAHYFYWIPGHPSKETMRIMADYVGQVLVKCRVE